MILDNRWAERRSFPAECILFPSALTIPCSHSILCGCLFLSEFHIFTLGSPSLLNVLHPRPRLLPILEENGFEFGGECPSAPPLSYKITTSD